MLFLYTWYIIDVTGTSNNQEREIPHMPRRIFAPPAFDYVLTVTDGGKSFCLSHTRGNDIADLCVHYDGLLFSFPGRTMDSFFLPLFSDLLAKMKEIHKALCADGVAGDKWGKWREIHNLHIVFGRWADEPTDKPTGEDLGNA